MGIFSILGAVTGIGDAISSISKHIADARIAELQAKGNEAKIAAEERRAALQMRRDVLVEEAKAGNKGTPIFRTLLAMPAFILVCKLLVYDKALGQWTGGRTEQLSVEMWALIASIYGFYFLAEIAVFFRRHR